MDLLDRVRPAAEDLLGRVDSTLQGLGAPAGHPVWTLMRRVGATPGDAFTHVVSLAPDPLRGTADSLRRVAADWPGLIATLPATVDSEGIAAQAYAAARPAIATDLDGLVDGLERTARYVEELAGWMAGARDSLAGEVAACLGSGQALALLGAPGGGIDSVGVVAAADLGARVLATVAVSLDEGWRIRQAWAPVLVEHPPTAVGAVPRLPAAHRIDVR